MSATAPASLIEAAARFLAAHPTASNLDILRFLTAARGEGAVQGIAINRVRALLREPAQQWLREERERVRNGDPGKLPASRQAPSRSPEPAAAPASAAQGKGPAASGGARPAAQPTPVERDAGAAGTAPRLAGAAPDPSAVELALREAFLLGVEARSRGDVVRGWAEVRKLQDGLVPGT